MGYIYARADEVLVILSSAALPALTSINNSINLELADLAALEREEWVERAWTYQETVNSKELLLTCEGEGSPLIPAMQFLDFLGYALSHLKGSFFDKLHAYPKLNAFEDIMADYYTAAFEERAALNIMSNMDRRVQQRAEDHFYAMIGAISTERASTIGKVPPCEAFMRVCERKGDFSFIYSAAKREGVVGRRWRPLLGDLPSIFPWHGVGSGQPGRLDHSGLWLDDMVVLQPGPPQEGPTRFVQEWLVALWGKPLDPQQKLEDAAYAALQVMGFTGSQRCVTAAQGYFFPFEVVTPGQVHRILVSTALRWNLGAPGLISYQVENETEMSYTPGIYVGTVEGKTSVSITLA
ncbi:hypothetical protein GQ44DRAFT_647349 [Phaeosphaeriaceae sp. PMI808]|nr:hypothetical protein GQ44DRAFT_647349 [Phaeosphaeriaceae sp. PMI808]